MTEHSHKLDGAEVRITLRLPPEHLAFLEKLAQEKPIGEGPRCPTCHRPLRGSLRKRATVSYLIRRAIEEHYFSPEDDTHIDLELAPRAS